MKKFFLLASCLIPVFAFAQEGSFKLKGTVGHLKSPAKVYLQYMGSNDEVVIDSSAINNGAFAFAGTIDSPKQGRLIIMHNGTPFTGQRQVDDYLSLYLEKGNISVNGTDSVKNATISGSAINDDNKRLESSLKPINEKISILMKEFQGASEEDKKSEEFQANIEKRYDALQDESKTAYHSFIKVNPNSYISLKALTFYAGSTPEVAEIESIFNSLSPEVKSSKDGKAFALKITRWKNTMVGATAPEFTQNSPEGKPIKLSDFKGKYVLIDFWASWCGPCRKENPNVVKAYNAYKDKNFEILGVSLDNQKGKDAWLKAIEKDGLTWPQVSDLKYWQNEVAQLYAVQSIPQNFLLDPNGKIIAKNLRGEELSSKLAELLH